MAAPKDSDRVSVASTTTGTGTLSLGGAMTGYRSFATAFGTGGNTEVYYGIIKEDTGEWEAGVGTFLGATNQLQRDTVLSSSNGGSLVSLPVGNKIVYVTPPAETTRVFRARRAADTVVEIRAASGQSGNLIDCYNSSGNVALSVSEVGTLELSTTTTTMATIPQDLAGATVNLQKTLLGSPGVPGIRFRWTGTGTTGVVQFSQGDNGYLQLHPQTGKINAVDSDGDIGVTFAEGIKILAPIAQIGAVSVGHIAFDCAGGSSDTSWDITPTNNTGSGTHSVRIGRTSGTSTIVKFTVLQPGTATTAVSLDGRGFANIGDYYVGASPDGTAGNYISRKTGSGVFIRSGVNSGTLTTFRDSDDATVATVAVAGTSSPITSTIITREKGDARFAAISAARFKENIEDAEGLAAIFPLLRPRRYVFGGELPDSDERIGTRGLGFVLEDMADVLPEACRYLGEGESRALHSRDDGAIIAVLHAKISEHEARLKAVESRRRRN